MIINLVALLFKESMKLELEVTGDLAEKDIYLLKELSKLRHALKVTFRYYMFQLGKAPSDINLSLLKSLV